MEKKQHKSMMIDNRMINENHQQGIGRVMQRKGDMKAGQGGKMGMAKEKAHWRRPNSASTPKSA